MTRVISVAIFGAVCFGLIVSSAAAAEVKHAAGTSYVAEITVSVSDANGKTKIESQIPGNSAEPFENKLGLVNKQSVSATIKCVDGELPREYVAQFRMLDGDSTLSAPKITTFANTTATITIDDKGSTIEIDVRIVEKQP